MNINDCLAHIRDEYLVQFGKPLPPQLVPLAKEACIYFGNSIFAAGWIVETQLRLLKLAKIRSALGPLSSAEENLINEAMKTGTDIEIIKKEIRQHRDDETKKKAADAGATMKPFKPK